MNDNEALRAPGHCLEPAEIEAFVEGRADQLAAHVEACPLAATSPPPIANSWKLTSGPTRRPISNGSSHASGSPLEA